MSQSEFSTSNIFSNATSINFNLLSTIPKQLIQQIRAEGDILMDAPIFSQKLWKEIRKTDFISDHNGINLQIFTKVFDLMKVQINEFFKVQNVADLFDCFDQDCDSFLNEDEQVIIFSALKEKMQLTANNLLKIQQYSQFKDLMKKVREMEVLIKEFQNQLRQVIYQNELMLYKQIGEERLDKFYDQYYTEFQQLDQEKEHRRNQLLSQQNTETMIIEDKLQKAVETVKVKPKKQLKEYQTQEKLVSLEERVHEALDFRKELNNLEKQEERRVTNLIEEKSIKQRRNLNNKHQKETKQQEIKIQEMEFNLIIQMKKAFEILLKKNGLHENEIKRIQTLLTKKYNKVGENEGERKRNIKIVKKQNEIFTMAKSIKMQPQNTINQDNNEPAKLTKSKSRNFSNNAQSKNFKANKTKLINIIQKGDILQFYIKKKYGADLPVNLKQADNQDIHQKIETILSVKDRKPNEKESLPSLCDLYDDELNLKQNYTNIRTEAEIFSDKRKKMSYINQLLQY